MTGRPQSVLKRVNGVVIIKAPGGNGYRRRCRVVDIVQQESISVFKYCNQNDSETISLYTDKTNTIEF